MTDRPRVGSMTGLHVKTRLNGRWSTGSPKRTGRICAIASCGREFTGVGRALYCSYACWLAAKRVTATQAAPEWRCERFRELDRLIEMGGGTP